MSNSMSAAPKTPSNEQLEVSCYVTSALIKYAQEKGFDQRIFFENLEDKKEILSNGHA
jgi:hypothetical protein